MRNALLIVVLATVSACGCKPDDAITVHKIPKNVSGLDGIRESALSTDGTPAAESPGQPSSPPKTAMPLRMVVALFQRPDAAWFFKVSGTPEKVGAAEPQWQTFIDDLKFDIVDGSEQPVWELPDGWTTGPPAPFRFATVKIPDSEIEIRVSKLGGQQDLLSNVNRWRASQLALPPATAENVDENFEDKTGKDGKYLLFDQQGTSSGQTMGGPFMNKGMGGPFTNKGMGGPFTNKGMGGPSRNRAGGGKASPTAKTTPSKLPVAPQSRAPQFDLVPPEGFELGKTSPMVVARFVKETDDGKVQISVVPLTAINQWNDNVNFWRQSVGLEKIDDAAVEALTQSVTVSAVEGKRIELLEDHDGSDQGLIGVMVKKDDLAWFFKLLGKRTLVRENQERFDQFLKDFSFKE